MIFITKTDSPGLPDVENNILHLSFSLLQKMDILIIILLIIHNIYEMSPDEPACPVGRSGRVSSGKNKQLYI